MPIAFTVKIVRLKVYICSYSDDLDLHSRSQLHLNVGKCLNLYFNSNISENISAIAFKLDMTVDLYMGYTHGRFDALDLGARSQWLTVL